MYGVSRREYNVESDHMMFMLRVAKELSRKASAGFSLRVQTRLGCTASMHNWRPATHAHHTSAQPVEGIKAEAAQAAAPQSYLAFCKYGLGLDVLPQLSGGTSSCIRGHRRDARLRNSMS